MTDGPSPDDRAVLLAIAEEAARAGAEVLCDYFRRVTDPAANSGGAGLEIETKGRNDLVSRADRESEEVILGRIRRDFPEHSFLGEEGGARAGASGGSDFQWIVDPLDGTANFLHGLPIWSISIACHYRGEAICAVVLEPVRDNLFAAALGCPARWNDRPLAVSTNSKVELAFLATGFPFRAHQALDVFLEAFGDVFLRVRGIRRCGSAALDLAYVAAGIFDGFFELRLAPWDVAAGAFLVRQAGGVVTDWDGGEGFLRSGNIVAATKVVHPVLLDWLRRHADEAKIAELVPMAPDPA